MAKKKATSKASKATLHGASKTRTGAAGRGAKTRAATSKRGSAPAQSISKRCPRKAVTSMSVSGIDAAANVLAAFKEPMHCKDITARAIEAGWKTKGKTPGATLHAAISREIRDKGREARFKKAGRGLFAANT